MPLNCPHFFQWLKYHHRQQQQQQGLWESSPEAMVVTVLVGPLMISGFLFSFQLWSWASALWVPQWAALAADNQKGNLIRLEKHFASRPSSSSLECCLLSHSDISKLLILKWLPSLEFFTSSGIFSNWTAQIVNRGKHSLSPSVAGGSGVLREQLE